jgi:hypothetical protein
MTENTPKKFRQFDDPTKIFNTFDTPNTMIAKTKNPNTELTIGLCSKYGVVTGHQNAAAVFLMMNKKAFPGF